MEEKQLLIDVDDVAFMLKVSKRTVWRYLSMGLLPEPIRFRPGRQGGGVRWHKAKFTKWVDKGCPI